jgi:hypothetical protein
MSDHAFMVLSGFLAVLCVLIVIAIGASIAMSTG